jgi:hypothetical protein
MTQDQTRSESGGKYKNGAKIIITFVTSLMIVVITVLIIIGPGADSAGFHCHPKAEGYNLYVNESWIGSDEITRYEDIPEQHKPKSDEARRFLQSRKVNYTPLQYSNISERQRQVFITAIEAGEPIEYESTERGVILPEYSSLSGNDIMYNNKTYHCQIVQAENN